MLQLNFTKCTNNIGNGNINNLCIRVIIGYSASSSFELVFYWMMNLFPDDVTVLAARGCLQKQNVRNACFSLEWKYRISGPHGGNQEDYSHLGCNAMQFGESLLFSSAYLFLAYSSSLKMKVIYSSEASGRLRATRCYNLKDGALAAEIFRISVLQYLSYLTGLDIRLVNIRIFQKLLKLTEPLWIRTENIVSVRGSVTNNDGLWIGRLDL
jgi:hypothetical protein